MLKKELFIFVFTSLLLTTSRMTFATQTVLDSWRGAYPSSTSGDIRCQLCHLGRDGGEPWNSYGRDIRNSYSVLDLATRTYLQAFIDVESLNSDDDDPSLNNLDEINNNTQPGWRKGRVNVVYDRNDQVYGVFSEPLVIDPLPDAIVTTGYPLEMVEIASGFTSPVSAIESPTAALKGQIFVLDQVGYIWRVDPKTGGKSLYVDVSDRLLELGAFSPGGYDERGLLGFAFHPNFTINGLIYLYASENVSGAADFSTLTSSADADHQSVLIELTVSNVADVSAPAFIDSVRELLRIDQPQFNHNGGALVFGPDGYLYIGLGDGGGADDQGDGHSDVGNGSDLSNPLGSILRIDPLGSNSSNGAYGIPSDNPFIDQQESLNEIFAYGFRNPWKLSFDQNGDLYAADVGQNDIEEINLVNKGAHYGWPYKEGKFFFDNNGEFSGIVTTEFPMDLPPVNLINPILAYDHDEGVSVTGGYVYRGSANRTLVGNYIFGDFLKRLFVGDLETGLIRQVDLTPDVFINSFMQDSVGELYFMGNATAGTSGTTGKLVKLQSTFKDELCLPIVTLSKNVAVVCL